MLRNLLHDPIRPLLAAGDQALAYFVRRDLCDEQVEPIEDAVWALPEAHRLLRRQRDDGSWTRPGKPRESWPPHRDALVETWKVLRVLVQQYEMDRSHEAIARAAEAVLGWQTAAGDIRGFIGNQYATYYTGALLGLLVDAGYEADPRVERGLRWLLAMRQDDGGWSIPVLTRDVPANDPVAFTSPDAQPLEPDRTRPFSHHWTGMVLRAFAAHPRYRRAREIQHAARLLASRFFAEDAYGSYREADHWLRFQFPYWWNQLVAALDVVTRIDPPGVAEAVAGAAAWLRDHQLESGLWRVSYSRRHRTAETERARAEGRWVSLAVCRVLRRLDGGPRRRSPLTRSR